MPEIDLPTVIFALVALFVAYKLRSVLGVRNNSERQPGGLLAPLRRAPGPPNPAVVQSDGAAPASVPPPAADRWKGVAEPDLRFGAASTPSRRRIATSRPKPFFPAHEQRMTWSSMLSPRAIPRPCAV